MPVNDRITMKSPKLMLAAIYKKREDIIQKWTKDINIYMRKQTETKGDNTIEVSANKTGKDQVTNRSFLQGCYLGHCRYLF